MTDLAAWILERVAEDEVAASGHEGTAYLRWHFVPYGDRGLGGTVGPREDGINPIAEDWKTNAYTGVAEHIARHDPARVLAQCAALRDAVERLSKTIAAADAHYEGPDYYGGVDACEDTLRALASVWADHPDYDPVWRLA